MSSSVEVVDWRPGRAEATIWNVVAIVLIALGVMLLLEEFVPHWGFHKTWPILLILIGVAKLLELTRPPEGPRIG